MEQHDHLCELKHGFPACACEERARRYQVKETRRAKRGGGGKRRGATPRGDDR